MKKVFVINQPASGWTEATKSVIGVRVDGLELSITVLSGAHLHEAAFVALLRGPLSEALRNAAKYHRCNPIETWVERGMSGRRSFHISWIEQIDGFHRVRQKEVLYISGHRKISEVFLFLPDLIPFLPVLDESGIEEVNIREVEQVDTAKYVHLDAERASEIVEYFLEENIAEQVHA